MHYLLIFCQVGFFDLTQSSRSKNRLIFINMDMEHTIVMDNSLVRTGIAHAVYWDVFIYQWCNPFLSRQNGVKHFWKSIITYIPKVQTKFLYAAIWSHWQPISISYKILFAKVHSTLAHGQALLLASNFPFINSLKICKCAINQDSLLLATLWYCFSRNFLLHTFY